MRNARLLRRFVGVAGLLLAGCAVGPDYAPPKPELPAQFSEAPKNAPAAPDPAALTRWWLVFNDPELNAIVERVARGNLELKQAMARVREARVQRAIVSAEFWPEIDASAGYNRAHGSANVVLPFGQAGGGGGESGATAGGTTAQIKAQRGAPAEATPVATSTHSPRSGGGAGASPFGGGGLPGVTTNLYQVGFDASWEIDLFGATRRTLEAVDASIGAAAEAQRGVWVSLLAETASTYFELRAVQQRLQIARVNLAAQRDVLTIIEAKFRAGFANDLEVSQQRAQVATTEATIPALEAAERVAEHALAVQAGLAPNALEAELGAAPATPSPLPTALPAGIPSELLRRRPDIRRAERELAQATAQVGVATAELFPRFSLTGMVGLDSSDAKHVGDWSSHYYSIAPGIHWPILDWGRVRANIRLQNEKQEEVFLGYQNTVAQALREVEDALVRYEEEQARRASLATAAEASRQAGQLARQRYEHGVTDLLTVLQTQRSVLEAEDALTQSDAALRTDLVALYKALGGGWE